MNERRALEIADSLKMVDVTYNGRPVYIEEVNTSRDTASIHYLNQPEYSQEVHLTQLVELK
jgi:small acid-soluble spore protein H (minor)